MLPSLSTVTKGSHLPRAYSMANRAVAREETRQRLVTAALSLIVEQGSTQQTMAQVADRAGVSTRTVYTHFSSFSELLSAAMSAITAQLSEIAPEPVDTEALAPEDALRRLVSQWFSELARNDTGLAALVGIHDFPELEEALGEARELRLNRVRAVLTLAERRALLRVPLASAVAMAYAITGYHAWASLVRDLQLSSEEAATLVSDAIVRFALA